MTGKRTKADYRLEIEALAALLATAGWARVVERMAAVVEEDRKVTENPYGDDRLRVISAARIALANEVVRWPEAQIRELQELVDSIGGVD